MNGERWYVGLTESEDEMLIQFTLEDGREIEWYIGDGDVPVVVTTDENRPVHVHEVSTPTVKALRALFDPHPSTSEEQRR